MTRLHSAINKRMKNNLQGSKRGGGERTTVTNPEMTVTETSGFIL